MPWVPLAAAAIGAVGQVAAARSAGRGGGGNVLDTFWQPRATPNSAMWSGFANIDPTIRALRRETLTNLPGYRATLTGAANEYGTALGDVRSRLLSNASPFIQARVNPTLERIASSRGELTSGLARRGIFGPLYNQTLSGFDADAARLEGEQRALAEQETLSSLLGLDTQRYNAALSTVQGLSQLDKAQQAVVAQDLAQELSALGLSQAEISAALQAAGLQFQQQQYSDEMRGRSIYAIGSGLSDIAKNWPSSPPDTSMSYDDYRASGGSF